MDFNLAYETVLGKEAGFSDDPLDSGGQRYNCALSCQQAGRRGRQRGDARRIEHVRLRLHDSMGECAGRDF